MEVNKMLKGIIILTATVVASGQFQCPGKDGQYPDERQCDKYWDCYKGEATELLCPDGLVFDPERTGRIYKCDHPFSVVCGNRTELQPPQSSPNCPRRHGFFSHPDSSICDVYYNCINGVGRQVKCTEGLHFDQNTGLCISYLISKRQNCRTDKNYNCPKRIEDGRKQMYSNLNDCRKFYDCRDGAEGIELSCSLGEVYNDAEQRCDQPENVEGCEDWYQKYEEFDYTTEDPQYF